MTPPRRLTDPPSVRSEVHTWVMEHLGDLAASLPPGVLGDDPATPMAGGQQAADAALRGYDVRG